MNQTKSLALCCSAILVCGCATPNPEITSANVVPLHEVITQVKKEIYQFYKTAPTQVDSNNLACSFTPKQLVPKKFTIKLNTINLTKTEPTVGLSDPIGVFSIAPSFSGSYSISRSAVTEIPLAIQQDKLDTILVLKDDLSPSAKTSELASLQEKMPLAYALWKLRDELTQVDHNSLPCLGKYDDSHPLRVTLLFDVVNKSAGGINLQILGFKFGNTSTLGAELHQSIDFEVPLGTTLIIQ